MGVTRKLSYAGAIAGLAAGAGVGALASSGRRVTLRHDDVLDELQAPPDPVAVHDVDGADGARIHVAEFGEPDAPPVVLLHGVTLQWRFWSAMIRRLAPAHRVFAVDTRGHGRSVAGSGDVTLSGAAHDLAIVLDEVVGAPATLVGHSMGGMILGTLVAERPDVADTAVAGMVFVSTSCGPPRSSPAAAALARGQAPLAALFTSLVDGPLPSATWGDGDLVRGLLGVAFGPDATATMVEDLRRMQVEMDPSVTAASLRSIAAYDVHGPLADFGRRRHDLPVGVIVGDVDRLTPPVYAREIARCFPGAAYRHLPAIGHQLPQEAPFELSHMVADVARRGAPTGSTTAAESVPA